MPPVSCADSKFTKHRENSLAIRYPKEVDFPSMAPKPKDPQAKTQGIVYLVGAGPGDPELVTLRGLRLIESADVILYDNLATPSLLTHAPEDVETKYVGRKRAKHAFTQQQINEMLVEYARGGKRVVRLKGGDPYLFGRGGEEAEALADAGIRFEVVPGVTSAVGVGAYAGVPLTHRDFTSAATFVTGHDVDAIDWSTLGSAETLVIFMGLTTFGDISRRLIEAGRAPSTPAVAVRWGTRGDQQTVEGTLETLPAEIRQSGLKPPALIIVGEVVSLRRKLNWFEKLPLFGVSIVVTRASQQAAGLSSRLRELGAGVIELPTIETRAPDDWGPLDRAIAGLNSYDWLIFTSANGVRYFTQRLDAGAGDLRDLRAKICAIGPATADAVASLHLKVDLMPEEYVAESVLAAFESEDLDGKNVLLPRAAVARDLIPVELRKRGALIDVVAAYQTVPPDASSALAEKIFAADEKPDWITFTSSSTVKNFAKLCQAEHLPGERLQGVRIASIGPVTSRTIRELGFRVDAQAREYTVAGLVESIIEA